MYDWPQAPLRSSADRLFESYLWELYLYLIGLNFVGHLAKSTIGKERRGERYHRHGN
jgi:hypothetical protein